MTLAKSTRPHQLIVVTLLLVSSLLLSACAPAQTHIITIGVVNLAPVLNPVFDGFKAGMTDLGYVEGKDVVYVYGGPAGTIDKLAPIAQDFTNRKDIDLILSLSTPSTQAVQAATANTDKRVVFAAVLDPVAVKFVPKLSHPGGNMTGIRHGSSESKRLEWLTRVVPNIKRIYIPYNPDDASAVLALGLVRDAASTLGIELSLRESRNTNEITAAINNIPDDVDAILILPDNLVASRLDDLVAAAIARKLPLAVPNGPQVEQGALVSYGFNFVSLGRQAARLADQVLKGVSPADIPVETTEYFLSINLKTAKIIGLDIPDKILQQADIVIR
ncbi:MAG: ABC transporter substrate-binding protein [Chloroflexota bacterium]